MGVLRIIQSAWHQAPNTFTVALLQLLQQEGALSTHEAAQRNSTVAPSIRPSILESLHRIHGQNESADQDEERSPSSPAQEFS
jgi:hypothetical protein